MAGSDLTGRAQTVLGTIDGDALGLTSCHEHVLWDFRGYYKEPEDEAERRRAHEPVTMENLLVNLVPVMKAVGLGEEDIQALLIDNPRKFLEFAPAAV